MTDALGFVEILQAQEYLVPPQTTFFRDFLECLKNKHVGWILMMKRGGQVGMNMLCQEQQCMMRLNGGTFNNQLGVEVLMEFRGGGRGGKENMTAAMTTKSNVIHIQR